MKAAAAKGALAIMDQGPEKRIVSACHGIHTGKEVNGVKTAASREEPSHEIDGPHGHADVEDDARQVRLAALSPKASIRPPRMIATSARPAAMVPVKAVCA